MAKQTQISRRAIRERARKRRKQRRVFPAILLVAIGVGFTIVAWYLLAGRSSAQTGFEHSSEDVVYDQSLTAVHEMEPLNLASIPFCMGLQIFLLYFKGIALTCLVFRGYSCVDSYIHVFLFLT